MGSCASHVRYSHPVQALRGRFSRDRYLYRRQQQQQQQQPRWQRHAQRQRSSVSSYGYDYSSSDYYRGRKNRQSRPSRHKPATVRSRHTSPDPRILSWIAKTANSSGPDVTRSRNPSLLAISVNHARAPGGHRSSRRSIWQQFNIPAPKADSRRNSRVQTVSDHSSKNSHSPGPADQQAKPIQHPPRGSSTMSRLSKIPPPPAPAAKSESTRDSSRSASRTSSPPAQPQASGNGPTIATSHPARPSAPQPQAPAAAAHTSPPQGTVPFAQFPPGPQGAPGPGTGVFQYLTGNRSPPTGPAPRRIVPPAAPQLRPLPAEWQAYLHHNEQSAGTGPQPIRTYAPDLEAWRRYNQALLNDPNTNPNHAMHFLDKVAKGQSFPIHPGAPVSSSKQPDIPATRSPIPLPAQTPQHAPAPPAAPTQQPMQTGPAVAATTVPSPQQQRQPSPPRPTTVPPPARQSPRPIRATPEALPAERPRRRYKTYEHDFRWPRSALAYGDAAQALDHVMGHHRWARISREVSRGRQHAMVRLSEYFIDNLLHFIDDFWPFEGEQVSRGLILDIQRVDGHLYRHLSEAADAVLRLNKRLWPAILTICRASRRDFRSYRNSSIVNEICWKPRTRWLSEIRNNWFEFGEGDRFLFAEIRESFSGPRFGVWLNPRFEDRLLELLAKTIGDAGVTRKTIYELDKIYHRLYRDSSEAEDDVSKLQYWLEDIIEDTTDRVRRSR